MVIWALLLGVTVIGAIFLSASVLPRMYLGLRYNVDKSEDRCIKRIYETNGQSMVFEPEEKWRTHVKQYVLSERGDKKEITCKLDKSINYIEMDVAVFNNQDKLECVIKIKDFVEGSGYTKTVELPEKTSYVSINVLRAENEYYEDKLSAKVSKGRMWKFWGVSTLLIVIQSLLVKISLANILGGVFRESFVVNLESTLITLGVALILIVLNTVTAIYAVREREKKFTVKVEKDAA